MMTGRKRFTIDEVSACAVTAELPELTIATDNAGRLIDLLIVSAGFEPRVLAIPQKLLKEKCRVGSILVARYRTNADDNNLRFRELLPILESLSDNIEYFDADSPESLIPKIKAVNGSVLLDVSGASCPLIFSMIGAVSKLCHSATLEVIYAEAGEYARPNDLDGDPKTWSPSDIPEEGASEGTPHPMFVGLHNEAASGIRVVAFPSLYTERLAQCLTYCGDALESVLTKGVVWVLPRTVSPDHEWRRDKIRTVVSILARRVVGDEDSEIKAGSDPDNSVDCDIHDYREAAKIVLEQAEVNCNKNLYVVHLGSKMQSVGIALALSVRTEVAALYARPLKFNAEKYSSGVGKIWHVNLGKVDALLNKLSRVGQITLNRNDGQRVA